MRTRSDFIGDKALSIRRSIGLTPCTLQCGSDRLRVMYARRALPMPKDLRRRLKPARPKAMKITLRNLCLLRTGTNVQHEILLNGGHELVVEGVEISGKLYHFRRSRNIGRLARRC